MIQRYQNNAKYILNNKCVFAVMYIDSIIYDSYLKFNFNIKLLILIIIKLYNSQYMYNLMFAKKNKIMFIYFEFCAYEKIKIFT